MLQEAEGLRVRRREPAINAPWVVTGLILALIAAHGARVWTGMSLDPLAVTSQDFDHGGYAQFITYQFAHGSWAHVLMNSAFVLAFGAPVARYFGEGGRGSLVFLVFFLVCGVLAAASYGGYLDLLAWLGRHPPPPWALVGASGAASGLMGAAARLIQGHGRVGQLGGRTVVAMTLAWIGINLVLGLSGLTPGAGAVPVAWQAHILGYFAGLLLIGPFGALAGATRRHQPLP
ncbi:MAG TPA: rhomboid family intramembrane serine protease [Caulobacteraceae bacterium]